MIKLHTGDDWVPVTQLYRSGQPFTISLSAIIKAAMIELATETIAVGPVTCLSSDPNADWPNSIVTASFSRDDTVDAPIGKYVLEYEVDDAGDKQTYQTQVLVVKGYIP